MFMEGVGERCFYAWPSRGSFKSIEGASSDLALERSVILQNRVTRQTNGEGHGVGLHRIRDRQKKKCLRRLERIAAHG